jgi:hypothetical protein
MDDRNERIATALEAVFRTYQQPDRGDEDTIARERIERARVYFEALELYDIRDIEAACRSILTGSAPGINPSFIPPAPAVAAECRRQCNLRCESEARDRAFRPKLPPPDIVRTPESQARVRDLVQRTVNGLKGPEDEDPEARHRRRMAKANAYFEDEAGFTVGDPEGEADAA